MEKWWILTTPTDANEWYASELRVGWSSLSPLSFLFAFHLCIHLWRNCFGQRKKKQIPYLLIGHCGRGWVGHRDIGWPFWDDTVIKLFDNHSPCVCVSVWKDCTFRLSLILEFFSFFPTEMHSGFRQCGVQRPSRSDQHLRPVRAERVLHADRCQRTGKIVRYMRRPRSTHGPPGRLSDRLQQQRQHHLVAIGYHVGRHSVPYPSQLDTQPAWVHLLFAIICV